MTVMQFGLFGVGEASVDADASVERTDLSHGAWVDVSRGWLRGADSLCDALLGAVPWQHNRRWMYDRLVDEPRLSRWYRRGDEMPDPALAVVGEALDRVYEVPLTGPGLNYYRTGRDSVAFHADRELAHLDHTIVAIVTLGATRPFLIRPQGGGRSLDLRPASGDLLVMGGACQAWFEHAVPKSATVGPRISASWRWAGRPA